VAGGVRTPGPPRPAPRLFTSRFNPGNNAGARNVALQAGLSICGERARVTNRQLVHSPYDIHRRHTRARSLPPSPPVHRYCTATSRQQVMATSGVTRNSGSGPWTNIQVVPCLPFPFLPPPFHSSPPLHVLLLHPILAFVPSLFPTLFFSFPLPLL